MTTHTLLIFTQVRPPKYGSEEFKIMIPSNRIQLIREGLFPLLRENSGTKITKVQTIDGEEFFVKETIKDIYDHYGDLL